MKSQMQQSEENEKKMMVQRQLQMVNLFANVLKGRITNGSDSSGN